MGIYKVRYLVAKKQKGHNLYYWQPKACFKEHGFLTMRLSNNHDEAIRQAMIYNKELDDWRNEDRALPYVRPGTLSYLVRQYQKDNKFTSLSPESQREYTRYLDMLDKWGGDFPIHAVSRRAAKAFLDMFAGKNRTMKYARDVCRLLFNHAIDIGETKENPFTIEIKSNPKREIIWEEAEIAQLFDTALNENRLSIAIATILAVDTGQRQTDVLKMDWKQYDGQKIMVRQSKTNKWVWIKATKRLKALLDKQVNKKSYLVVNEITGKPYTMSNFVHVFIKIFDKTTLRPELQYRDFRRTAVLSLALVGCTTPQIASITGHSIEACQKIIDVYLPRDSRLAHSAITKLDKQRAKVGKKVGSTQWEVGRSGAA